MALLAAAVVGLFRPGFVRNQIFPRYEPVSVERFSEDAIDLNGVPSIRLGITRHTDYGDRYKLFSLEAPNSPNITKADFGLAISKDDIDYSVDNVTFNGAAEKAGVTFGDVVTAVELERTGTPKKDWIYIPAFLLLAMAVFLNYHRRRRDAAAAT